ncbi:MAG: MFS transporter [Micrococcaceae bacterium]
MTSKTTSVYRWRWVVMFAVIAADIMDLLDATMLNVAGPSIREDIGGSPAVLQWLTAGYTLSFAMFLIAGARLGDIFGRRRMFIIGISGFTLASALCALFSSPELLIVLRIFQGAFGAVLIPQGVGMLMEVFEESEMAKVFSTFGMIMTIGTVAGPIIGGLLISVNWFNLGWRLVFLVNVPIGILALIGAIYTSPKVVTHEGTRLDIPGTALIGIGIVSIVYPLIEGREAGWPMWTFLLIAFGVLLSILFVWYEQRRSDSPLIEHSLMKNQTFWIGMLAVFAFFATYGGISFIISVFCQVGQHFSPIKTAMTLLPMVVSMVIARFTTDRLSKILGRKLIHIGIGLVALGIIILAVTAMGKTSLSIWAMVPAMAVIGFGSNYCLSLIVPSALTEVSKSEIGSASGVINAIQQIAGALGTAVLGTLFFAWLFSSQPATHALSITLWVCLVPLVIAFVLAFKLPK